MNAKNVYFYEGNPCSGGRQVLANEVALSLASVATCGSF